MKNIHFLVLLFPLLIFGSCTKETETFAPAPLSNYMPLSTGKYIIYRLDSTLFTRFGTTITVNSYQEKNEVEALVQDALGRPSYRIFRYIRDTAGAAPWEPSGSYYITPTENAIEFIENNLRSVRLASPVKENFSWNGNGFYPNSPYSPFNITVDNGIQQWPYTYTELAGAYQYKNRVWTDVLTVTQVDDSSNVPIVDAATFASVTRAIDRYAKGIGLVSQELSLWEYQFDGARGQGYRNGFIVKRAMIDHN